ncbi:MAG: hypothetical protein ACK5YO_34120, partial [Planctomyces sp.]
AGHNAGQIAPAQLLSRQDKTSQHNTASPPTLLLLLKPHADNQCYGVACRKCAAETRSRKTVQELSLRE